MADTTILKKVIAEVERIHRSELANGFVYHDLAHTKSVVKYSEEFAKHYQVEDSDQEILAIAAWFHDIGYSKGYMDHEDQSELIARAFLQAHDYPPEKIEYIAQCIQATKVETLPNNILEEIIKDADLSNLGEESFSDYSQRLRQEWDTFLDEQYTDKEWYKINKGFLEKHKYFTSIAKERFEEVKKWNYKELKRSWKERKKKKKKKKKKKN